MPPVKSRKKSNYRSKPPWPIWKGPSKVIVSGWSCQFPVSVWAQFNFLRYQGQFHDHFKRSRSSNQLENGLLSGVLGAPINSPILPNSRRLHGQEGTNADPIARVRHGNFSLLEERVWNCNGSSFQSFNHAPYKFIQEFRPLLDTFRLWHWPFLVLSLVFNRFSSDNSSNLHGCRCFHRFRAREFPYSFDFERFTSCWIKCSCYPTWFRVQSPFLSQLLFRNVSLVRF